MTQLTKGKIITDQTLQLQSEDKWMANYEQALSKLTKKEIRIQLSALQRDYNDLCSKRTIAESIITDYKQYLQIIASYVDIRMLMSDSRSVEIMLLHKYMEDINDKDESLKLYQYD